MLNKLVNGTIINYLYEINKQSIHTYFQMKCKNNLFFSLEEKQIFIQNTKKEIELFLQDKKPDYIIFPETTNQCFIEIIQSLNIPSIALEKRNKTEILSLLDAQKMMKQERQKLNNAIQQMNDIKIGLIAANQRQRIANILFKPISTIQNKKLVFLDDSIFTGHTFKAIQQQYHIQDTLVLFSQSI